MRKDVKDYIQKCDTCQRIKPSNHLPFGLLQPLPPPDSIWSELSMDFLTHLPSAKGYTVILVVVNRLTKGAHFVPLPTHYSASKVAEAFWDVVGKIHGPPQYIISDRDPVFLSTFWKTLFHLHSTTLKYSSSYHPEIDGQTEHVNCSLEQYLRSFVFEHPKLWLKVLPWAKFHYNIAFNHSIGTSPFEATFGRRLPCLLRYSLGLTSVEAVDSTLTQREQILNTLRTPLAKAQSTMKQQADLKRKDCTFKPGDLVLLRLRLYRQPSLVRRSSQKLAAKFFGPYTILENIGQVAFRLDLPSVSKIHSVFHASLLRPYHASTNSKVHPLPSRSDALPPLHVPVAIIAERTIFRNGGSIPHVLVQWLDIPPGDTTWEDAVVVRLT